MYQLEKQVLFLTAREIHCKVSRSILIDVIGAYMHHCHVCNHTCANTVVDEKQFSMLHSCRGQVLNPADVSTQSVMINNIHLHAM